MALDVCGATTLMRAIYKFLLPFIVEFFNALRRRHRVRLIEFLTLRMQLEDRSYRSARMYFSAIESLTLL